MADRFELADIDWDLKSRSPSRTGPCIRHLFVYDSTVSNRAASRKWFSKLLIVCALAEPSKFVRLIELGSAKNRLRPNNRHETFSRRTFLAFLSTRSAINRLCRKWASSVHSTNSNCPTRTGRSHRHSLIFAAVNPAPQRPAFFSGRLAKGHSLTSRGLIFLNNSTRVAGVSRRQFARRILASRLRSTR